MNRSSDGAAKKWFWAFLYLLSILLGNAFVIWFGIVTVGGLSFPAGVLWIGLTFSFRDFVQRYWGDWATWAWMIAASIITCFLNWQVALASVSAFLVSEGVDWYAYRVLKKDFVWRVVISNLISCPLDSLIFVGLAFGLFWPVIGGQALLKYLSGLLVLPFILAGRRKETQGMVLRSRY
ncbi:MAG TPA: VUT family protein [Syntrophales bacterium]|nr:VUT family protein [Syntrophales bacterium]HOX94749.1 VUT family protein [Syntrophales bacterium]HPI56031.1 VUT family protein [Syntrophales bacterium]HPN24079.1 VUT family protein [Syntrophales bacterium]HQM28358.1 VUT family protein [Syntrophales bacterium]